MAKNLSEIFSGGKELTASLADYFLDHIHVRLISCGIRTTSCKRMSDFMMPTFLAVAYQSGSVEIQHGAEATVLKPGSFFLFRPYDVYSGKMVGDAALRFAYMQFDIAPFMERYDFGLSALNFTDTLFLSDRYERFGPFLAELAEDDAGDADRTGMLKQLIRLLIAQIVYDQAKRDVHLSTPQKGRDSTVINRAYQYVADHLSEPIRIGEILKYEGISKATLEKTFQRMLSTTPQRALLRFKIERSMEMLQYDTPINKIVQALGFSSAYHYSNAFMAVAGIRPTEYRRQIASGRTPNG